MIKNEKNFLFKFSEGQDDPHKLVKQVIHTQDTESEEYKTPLFQPLQPDELTRCTFITTQTDDGQCFCAHIISHIEEIDNATGKAQMKFLVCKSDDDSWDPTNTLKFLKNGTNKNSIVMNTGNSKVL